MFDLVAQGKAKAKAQAKKIASPLKPKNFVVVRSEASEQKRQERVDQEIAYAQAEFKSEDSMNGQRLIVYSCAA